MVESGSSTSSAMNTSRIWRLVRAISAADRSAAGRLGSSRRQRASATSRPKARHWRRRGNTGWWRTCWCRRAPGGNACRRGARPNPRLRPPASARRGLRHRAAPARRSQAPSRRRCRPPITVLAAGRQERSAHAFRRPGKLQRTRLRKHRQRDPPHPITERIALTVFAQARPLQLSRPPEGVRTTLLAASSQDSYRRPAAVGGSALASAGARAARCRRPRRADAGGRSRRRLAGRRARQAFPPGARRHQQVRHQRSISPTSPMANFRSRCCAGSLPTRRPQASSLETYQLPEIALTSRQMRDVFIALEVLLPLSTMLCGVLVWWRRR